MFTKKSLCPPLVAMKKMLHPPLNLSEKSVRPPLNLPQKSVRPPPIIGHMHVSLPLHPPLQRSFLLRVNFLKVSKPSGDSENSRTTYSQSHSKGIVLIHYKATVLNT